MSTKFASVGKRNNRKLYLVKKDDYLEFLSTVGVEKITRDNIIKMYVAVSK